MKILQISGSGRGSGKTTLGCALIQAFPALRWSVLKLTPHAHSSPQPPDLGTRMDSTDTDRYLAAGAHAALLLDSTQSRPIPVRRMSGADVVLVESGQPILNLPWPLLHLAIAPLDAPASWKPEFLARLGAGGEANGEAIGPQANPCLSRCNAPIPDLPTPDAPIPDTPIPDALILHGDPGAAIPPGLPPHLLLFRPLTPTPLTPDLKSFVAEFLARLS